MSMWEPFTKPARRVIVRAQEVAQMFGSRSIGTEHLTFALGEGEGEVARLLANAVDREALRTRLGTAASAPVTEMVFTGGAKRAIELAFEHARRFTLPYIGEAHLALGVLGCRDVPPLIAGIDLVALNAALDDAGKAEERTVGRWTRVGGTDEEPAVAASILRALQDDPMLGHAGTRVSVTVHLPGGAGRAWMYLYEEKMEA